MVDTSFVFEIQHCGLRFVLLFRTLASVVIPVCMGVFPKTCARSVDCGRLQTINQSPARLCFVVVVSSQTLARFVVCVLFQALVRFVVRVFFPESWQV